MTIDTTTLPDWFLEEVAAARAELADVAPQVFALIAGVQDRYVRVEATFNELVPPEPDEVWEPLWEESGARQLQERLGDLLAQVTARIGGQ